MSENDNEHKKNMRNTIDYNRRISRRGGMSENNGKNAPLSERKTLHSDTDNYGSKNGYGTRRIDRTYYENRRKNYADEGLKNHRQYN